MSGQNKQKTNVASRWYLWDNSSFGWQAAWTVWTVDACGFIWKEQLRCEMLTVQRWDGTVPLPVGPMSCLDCNPLRLPRWELADRCVHHWLHVADELERKRNAKLESTNDDARLKSSFKLVIHRSATVSKPRICTETAAVMTFDTAYNICLISIQLTVINTDWHKTTVSTIAK